MKAVNLTSFTRLTDQSTKSSGTTACSWCIVQRTKFVCSIRQRILLLQDVILHSTRKQMAELPLEPMFSKVLIMSKVFSFEMIAQDDVEVEGIPLHRRSADNCIDA